MLRIDTTGTNFAASRSPSPSGSPVQRDRSPSPLGSPWQSEDGDFDDVRSEYSEAPPDLTSVHDLLATMRGTLNGFNLAIETLSEQVAHVSRLAPTVDADWQVRAAMRDACSRGLSLAIDIAALQNARPTGTQSDIAYPRNG